MNNGAERLVDVSASGRQRPWNIKKSNNEILALVYKEIDNRKAERLEECCTELWFKQYQDGKKRLDKMNSCRVRLCPICNWRRSLKVYGNMSEIMVDKECIEYAFLYLTLTVENVTGENLSETIDSMMAAFKRLVRKKQFLQVVKGYYRAMEVTHNVNPASKSFDTYHPHFHVVLAVEKQYFKSREYMSHEEWQNLWQSAIKTPYKPIIDIRKVKGNTTDAVAEAAGYAVKDSEYIIPENWSLTVDTVRILDKALHKRRFISYGGILKAIHKRLNLDDEETGDLVNVGNDVEAEGEHIIVHYAWISGYQQYLKD